MKLVSYFAHRSGGNAPDVRLGALNAAGTAVIDLEQAARRYQLQQPGRLASMLAFLEAWPASSQTARELLEKESPSPTSDSSWLPSEQIRLAAPLPVPNSIRDCMTYEQHLVQSMRTMVQTHYPLLYWLDRLSRATTGFRVLRPPRVWYQRPLYYKGNCRSVVGPEADIHWPSYDSKLDFELEFGVVIGKRGRDISPQQAHEFIAGYTLFNDFSAREIQLAEMRGHLGPAKSKDFDSGNALGPYLVTSDELGDISQLMLSTELTVRSGHVPALARCNSHSPRSSPTFRRTRHCIRVILSPQGRYREVAGWNGTVGCNLAMSWSWTEVHWVSCVIASSARGPT